MTPLPHFQCITPLGPAICIGVIDETDDVEWVTFINATGEPWYWRNPEFRLAPCITAGRSSVSPFPPPSEKLAKEIKRYRDNDWLGPFAVGFNE